MLPRISTESAAVPVIMKALLDAGLMHGDVIPSPGRRCGKTSKRSTLRPSMAPWSVKLDDPLHESGGLTILHGSLAPEGAIVGSAGFALNEFTGPARVFEREREAMDALTEGKINHGDVVVIRYEGPKGGPGCARCSRSQGPSKVRVWEVMYYC